MFTFAIATFFLLLLPLFAAAFLGGGLVIEIEWGRVDGTLLIVLYLFALGMIGFMREF